jgi:hypothetical protein
LPDRAICQPTGAACAEEAELALEKAAKDVRKIAAAVS